MKFILSIATTLAVTCLSSISTQAQTNKEPVIVMFGASLATGFRLPRSQGLVPKLQAALNSRGIRAKIVNRSRNGRTMAQGANAIGFALSLKPDAVIVSLGGNDLLRRKPVGQTRANLNKILSALKARKVDVLVTAIDPVTRSAKFRNAYNQSFKTASRRHGTLLLKDFYRPLQGRPDRKLRDGIHPNAAGVDALVARLLPKTIALIKRARR